MTLIIGGISFSIRHSFIKAIWDQSRRSGLGATFFLALLV
jgi:hypothetical protein